MIWDNFALDPDDMRYFCFWRNCGDLMALHGKALLFGDDANEMMLKLLELFH